MLVSATQNREPIDRYPRSLRVLDHLECIGRSKEGFLGKGILGSGIERLL